MNPNRLIFKRSSLALITATLVACGGGWGTTGSNTPTSPVKPTTPATPVPTLANARGFWSATPSATSSVGAVILPNGQVWVIYQEGSTVTALAQGALSLKGSSYTGIGNYYSLPAGAVQDFSLNAISGNATVTTTTPTLTTNMTVGTGTSNTQTWTYNKAYESVTTVASVQGRWSGAQGAVSLNWDIDASGKLAGTSTTGCVYSGTVTPNESAASVLDVAVTENCAGTAASLNGIALQNTDKTGLSVAYTTAAGAKAGVLMLQK